MLCSCSGERIRSENKHLEHATKNIMLEGQRRKSTGFIAAVSLPYYRLGRDKRFVRKEGFRRFSNY